VSFENQDSPIVQQQYHERYRPHIHFTPESMWMNDPNGLVYFEGEYHLFYQYHPHGKQWGPMHWGHAVSKDLLSWKHLPIALYPDNLGMIFSGSVVVDWHDTSGLFGGGKGLVAYYTHAYGEVQRQSMAYSRDNGRTWVKVDENPIIPNPGIVDFRDPKVLWHEESSQWVMVVTAGRKIWFYTSENLKDWSFVNEFGEGWGAQEGIWECPDLFSLKDSITGEEKWVLQIGIDAGGPAEGSGTQYFVGDFDGHTFVPSQSKHEVKWLDYGKDFYAAQSFSDTTDGRRLILAWMSNWQYANDVPTDPWRSAMSIPRELRLENGHVKQAPVSELGSITESVTYGERRELNVGALYKMEQPQAPFQLDLDVELAQQTRFEVRLFGGFIFSVDRDQNVIYVKRDMGDEETFSKDFPGVFTTSIENLDERLNLSFVCDHSSIEVFMNDGAFVWTNLYLPAEAKKYSLEITSSKGATTIDRLTVREFESVMVRSVE